VKLGQVQKAKVCMFSLTCGIQAQYKYNPYYEKQGMLRRVTNGRRRVKGVKQVNMADVFFFFFFIVVLGGVTLWHLQMFLQYIKYIIVQFTPSTILLHPPSQMYFLYKKEYRIFKPVDIIIRGLR
jgi:uncharacterized protein YybS (DUF2232 family)